MHIARLRKAGSLELAQLTFTCPGCGIEVRKAQRGGVPVKWCSKVCRNRAVRQASLAAPSPTVCATCGGTFQQVRTNGRNALYCSTGCRQRSEAHREAQRRCQNERRAIIYGTEAEQFDAREVFERDGWVCQLCQEPVDRALQWPDPRSPSLDHRIPLSWGVERGGVHTRANSQLAHLDCNNRKGARLAA